MQSVIRALASERKEERESAHELLAACTDFGRIERRSEDCISMTGTVVEYGQSVLLTGIRGTRDIRRILEPACPGERGATIARVLMVLGPAPGTNQARVVLYEATCSTAFVLLGDEWVFVTGDGPDLKVTTHRS